MEMTEWWLKPLAWLFARHPDWRDASGRLLLRVGSRFYLGLALLLGLAGAWDQFIQPFNQQFSDASFDWLMSHRPVPYRPDPAIAILDIDEASLAALAPQYGRWPWPREVLAQVAAPLEAAGATAVLFDILFADPDVVNPVSERAFDRYVSGSRVSFYPATRLDSRNDPASDVTVAALNFAAPDPALAPSKVDGGHTVAIVPPYFKSIYDSTRVGTYNIVPDRDNVVRWYPNWEALGGYRIPSLPMRMAQVLRWPQPGTPRSLINWPRGITPYLTISFADAHRAAVQGDRRFFQALAGKVVLIGSTAPSLGDVKATPVSHLHPGISILATVVDNTKNARFLRPLAPGWIWGFELLMLAASARLFSRTERSTYVAKYFVIIPSVLLGISLVSLSVSDLLIDLSVPTAMMLAYFTFAGIFEANSRAFSAGSGVFAPSPQELTTGVLQVACLPPTVSRREIEPWLIEHGCPIKLWVPPKAGLGLPWSYQGWVLWRWRLPGADEGAGPDGGPFRWRDVPTAAGETTFPLVRTIAAAAMDTIRKD